jgi:hypothetical protein
MRMINLELGHMKRAQIYQLSFYAVLFSIVFISLISRLLFNGLSLNFDYGLYQPDGAHYFYRTLVFLGHDSFSASNQVADWYRLNGIKNNIFDPAILRPENEQLWGLVSPRLLYPLLSVPFVWLFGAAGMLVVPILSFLILSLFCFLFAKNHGSKNFGLILVFAVTLSPTILRWMISNVTDSLLSAIFAATAYVLSLNLSKTRLLTYLSIFIFCSSLTRFALPIWLAISFVLFLNTKRFIALFTSVASTLISIPVFISAPDDALLPGSNPVTLWEKVSGLAISFLKVGFYEVAELAALDRVLLVMLLSALWAAVIEIKRLESQYFIAVLISVWLIGAINGTVGVNFRYQMPLLGFMFWVLSANFLKFRNWIFGNGLNVIRGKAQN